MRVTCLERVYSPSLRRSLPSFPLPSLRQRGPGRARASGGAPGCVRGGARSSAVYKGTNGKNTLAHERLMCGETAPPLRSLLKAPAPRRAAGAHPGAPRGAAAPAHRRHRDPRVTRGSGTQGTPCSGGAGRATLVRPWERGGVGGICRAAVALCGQQQGCSGGRSGENKHKRWWKHHQQSPGSCT